MPCAVIDLFCGIGGLTHGLIRSGLQVLAGIDIDSTCQYAYEKNNDALFIEADVAHLASDGIVSLYPAEAVRALVGCAPCQPFSKYTQRYRKDGHKGDKWRLLYSFAEKVTYMRIYRIFERLSGLYPKNTR